MRTLLNYLLLALALWGTASTAAPLPSNLAQCTRSANLLACVDPLGNAYSVATAGSHTYLRGFEAIGNRYWAQTNSRYGQLTFSPAWPPTAKPGSVTAAAWAGPPSIGFPAPVAAAPNSPATGSADAEPQPLSNLGFFCSCNQAM